MHFTVVLVALAVFSECSFSRSRFRSLNTLKARLQQFNDDINRIEMDLDSRFFLNRLTDSEIIIQLEISIWKSIRTVFQINYNDDRQNLFTEIRQLPIYRDDDPNYIIQFRADVSNLGRKRLNNQISSGSVSYPQFDLPLLTNVTVPISIPKLKAVGRKKSWKNPFRSNELQRNIDFLHNLNATQSLSNTTASAVVEAIYLDVDGLVAASLIQKAATMIEKEYANHNVVSAPTSFSASPKAAASLSGSVKAIFISASRVVEPTHLFRLDR